jgi:hypothetical protein
LLRTSTRAVIGLAAAAALVPGVALAKPGHGHGQGHGNPHLAALAPETTTTTPVTDDTQAPPAPVEGKAHGQGHGKHKAKGHAKPHKLVVKGTVVSIGGAPTTVTDPPVTDPTATAAVETPSADVTTVTIHVTKANHHGKALVGQDVTFTIPEGGVRAADRNKDGKVDLADVNVGDKVVVQTRKIAVDAAQPFAARKLVDQTSRQEKDDEDADEAPETPAPAPATT